MAQRPWDILKEKTSSLEEASEFLKKSVREWTTLPPPIGNPNSRSATVLNSAECDGESRKQGRTTQKGGIASAETKTAGDTRDSTGVTSVRLQANPPIAQHLLNALFQLSNAIDRLLGPDERNKRRRRVFDGASSKSGNKPTQFPFRRLRVRGVVQLLPIYFNRPEFGIRLFLAEFLMKYIPEFQGVCIAFRKLRATDNRGFVCDAEKLGVITLCAEIEALVFGPQQGYTLPARVSDVRESSIELVLLDTWEVSIPSNRLVEGSVLSRKWIDDATGELYKGLVIKVIDPLKPSKPPGIIKAGSDLKFSVVKVNCGATQESNYFNLQGSLRASDRYASRGVKESRHHASINPTTSTTVAAAVSPSSSGHKRAGSSPAPSQEQSALAAKPSRTGKRPRLEASAR